MYLSVTKVKPLPNHELELTFENGAIRVFDVKSYLGTGLFRKLRDIHFFNLVRVAFGSVEWPGGLDLDPEVLYEDSRPVACRPA